MRLQITIDGRAYAVDVEVLDDDEIPETPSHAPLGGAHTQSHSAGWDAEGRVCHSPLMGLVIKVNVKPGQQVEAGEILLLLEAMKMETQITAPRAGTVKSVFVAQGDPVKQNQILAELE